VAAGLLSAFVFLSGGLRKKLIFVLAIVRKGLFLYPKSKVIINYSGINLVQKIISSRYNLYPTDNKVPFLAQKRGFELVEAYTINSRPRYNIAPGCVSRGFFIHESYAKVERREEKGWIIISSSSSPIGNV